jgi:hypothetical protein
MTRNRRSLVTQIGFLVLLGSHLGGCATTGALRDNLDGWVGSPIDQFMISWGRPSKEDPLPNAAVQYTWLFSGGLPGGTLVLIADYDEYMGQIDAGAHRDWCEITVTAGPPDLGGKIIDSRFRGTRCKELGSGGMLLPS